MKETMPSAPAVPAEKIPVKESLLQDKPLSQEESDTFLNNGMAEIQTINAKQDQIRSKIDEIRKTLGASTELNHIPSVAILEQKKEEIGLRLNEAQQKKESQTITAYEEILVQEKRKLVKDKLKDLVEKILSLVSDKSADSFNRAYAFTTNLFGSKKTEENSAVLKRITQVIIENGYVPEEFLKENPDINEQLEKDVEGEAKEVISNREVPLPPAREIPIGYEGGEYTPESLINRVQEQNTEAENSPAQNN